MTDQKRGPGRPPADDPSEPITFTIPRSLAAWVRQMKAGQRSKWLAEKIRNDPDFEPNGALDGSPAPTPPDDTAS